MTTTAPNLYRKWPKCYWRGPRHFCVACFSMLEFILATSEFFSVKNLLKKTTSLIWPLYIGPQGSHLIKVWLHYWFCVSWFLLWFGQGYTHMISSSWSASNAYFYLFGEVNTPVCFGKILCKFYLSMNDHRKIWYKLKVYLYLCMYVLR